MKDDEPGFVALMVFAGLAALLSVWWATSGDWEPAIGFGVLAVAQVLTALRARGRDRAFDDGQPHPSADRDRF
ncbi:hypothetical protein G5T42_08170 [Microbacterium sp. 4R-513]|uniref:hypothetical protein n=1 Tax=Microbacterium sp. 4R-513 TaxID=2567934 RepID=UPI0013E1A9BC|nr:hypothetical protein [Microbacterium sp. 4R-513]QIG39461.1 hypothetical protein G5T42_08170 [Microbacterium sp. 4R-513]